MDHFPLPGNDDDDEAVMGGEARKQGKGSQLEIDRARANEASDRTPRIDRTRNEAAAGGSGTVAVDSDDLSVFVHLAGPLEKKGTYRLRVVLYDGFQPLTAGPGLVVGASTSRRWACFSPPTFPSHSPLVASVCHHIVHTFSFASSSHSSSLD